MGPARILIVDDEPQIRKFLRVALGAHSFEVIEAQNGREGVQTAALKEPDLVILDLGLPDMDGKDVIARLREWSSVPVLVLSVRDGEEEKVAALDAGANDYVVKPFGIPEFLARVRVLLRPVRRGGEESAEIVIGELKLDLARHGVALGTEPLRLTPKEFELLAYLMRNAGRILTHRQILTSVWGPANAEDVQYLRVFVGRLRQKLGDDPASPRYILNEPGVGYRFLRPEE
ncbi:response regulator [Afifella sp. IM 167]|uniref:response regulator n=1 Tax=Afifella sp. IM 167 TaxID=2033586 RepID=UPI001CD03BA1|nr:response regulator [Afifella sp. IM 167]MBZ8134426.1 DNA-binding response regulator [Afifella sp. IM 167]